MDHFRLDFKLRHMYEGLRGEIMIFMTRHPKLLEAFLRCVETTVKGSKVPPIRAQYLDRSGPMRTHHPVRYPGPSDCLMAWVSKGIRSCPAISISTAARLSEGVIHFPLFIDKL